MDYLAVGLGGAIGAMCRHLMGTIIPKPDGGFPLPTLVINILGCFLLGLLSAAFARHGLADSKLALFCQVGLCGGFTTFSTFSNETFQLMQAARPRLPLSMSC